MMGQHIKDKFSFLPKALMELICLYQAICGPSLSKSPVGLDSKIGKDSHNAPKDKEV